MWTSFRGWNRGSGGPRITKAATPVWCSRPLRCLRSRRLRSSSLARRQSPWGRAVRLGRKRFFVASTVTMVRCDMGGQYAGDGKPMQQFRRE